MEIEQLTVFVAATSGIRCYSPRRIMDGDFGLGHVARGRGIWIRNCSVDDECMHDSGTMGHTAVDMRSMICMNDLICDVVHESSAWRRVHSSAVPPLPPWFLHRR